MIIRAKEQGYQYCNSGNCQQDCTTDIMCDQNCKGNCNQNCATGDRCVQSCSIDGNCKQTCHSSACLQRCTKGQKCNMTCQATDHCEQVCCEFVSSLTRFDVTSVVLYTLSSLSGVAAIRVGSTTILKKLCYSL